MRIFKGKLLVFAVAIMASTLTVVVTLQSQGRASSSKTPDAQGRKEENQMPVVDFDSAESPDPEARALRRKKSARHDKEHFVNKNDASGNAVESVFFDEQDSEIPALPTAQSDVILVGVIKDAQAHLSNDRTGIYSEFTTAVEEFLKSAPSVTVGASVSLERKGGAVRYPSGRRYQYRVSGRGMPQLGRKYVFFLKATEIPESFRIVTAYELRGSAVFPLDSADQFDVYRGVDEVKFLDRLRKAIP